jgi:membrane protease YdiL (CAAX protease family)
MSPVAAAFVGYAVAVAATLGTSLLAEAVLVFLAPARPSGRALSSLGAVLLGGFASSTTLLAVALVATRPPRRPRLRLGPGRASARAMAVMAVGVLALGQALDSLAVVLGLEPSGTLDVIRRALAGASVAMLGLAVAGLGILAGVCEEVFFRGFMQTRLRERWPRGPAIVTAALGFGILHLDRTHATLAFMLGLYLGWVAERSESTVPAVVCHVVNNAVSVILTGLIGGVGGVGPNLLLLGATTAVFLGALGRIQRLVPSAAGGVGGSPGFG